MSKQKLLFFSPNAAIWLHAFPEALIAEALQKNNCEIEYITCGGLFNSFCVSMSAFGLTEFSSLDKKKSICKICNQNKKMIKNEFNFIGIDLQEKITCEITNKVNLFIKSVNKFNFLEFSVNNIPIGKLATYEFFLNYKIVSNQLNDEQFKIYKIALKNCLLVFFIMDQYLKDSQPNKIICYNNLYSVNNIVCQIAKQNNVPYYSMHSGINWARPLETLLISQNSLPSFLFEAKNHWDKYSSIPCSKNEVEILSKYFLSFTKKTNVFVYSPEKTLDPLDLKRLFNIKENQKVLVAAMSSEDERFTAEIINALDTPKNLIFETQAQWINYLINEIKSREDLFLIIRVHPREFPNAREKVKSFNASLMEEMFTNLPKNIAINWPSQNISLYDIIDIADVFLIAWSGVGIEICSLGLPVIVYSSELNWNSADLYYCASSRMDYMNQVDRALSDGWSFERIRKTYRWVNFSVEKIALDISNSFSYKAPKKDFASRLRRKFLSIIMPNYSKINDFKKKAPFLNAHNEIIGIIYGNKKNIFDTDLLDKKYIKPYPGEDEEAKYIKQSLFRICYSLYKGKEEKENSNLYNKISLKLNAEIY